MKTQTIRVRVVYAAEAADAERYRCEELALGPVGQPRGGAIDLLLVDARAMSPETLAEALGRVPEWRREDTIRHAMLIWPKPELEGVVRAIRAGIQDVVPVAPPMARLVRRLCRGLAAGQRRCLARRLASLLRLGRPAAARGECRNAEAEQAAHLADERRAQYDRQLAEREALLAQREQELRATATRVQADLARASQACSFVELAAELRAELERRETELRLMAQQAGAAQAETAVVEKPAVRAEAQRLVETQRLSLDRRERALAVRERWLRDYERALTGGRVLDAEN